MTEPALELTRNIEFLEAMTLFRLAKRCGPQFLDNAESFDGLLGAGAFAVADGKVLAIVRRMVEGGLDDLPQARRDRRQLLTQVHQDHLDGE